MDLNLKGKRALVSGSTAGIGLAIATTLGREGARVIVNGRSQSSVDAAVAQLTSAGADVQGTVWFTGKTILPPGLRPTNSRLGSAASQ